MPVDERGVGGHTIEIGLRAYNGTCGSSTQVASQPLTEKTYEILAPPDCTITAEAAICAGTNSTASVADAGVGASYDWTVTCGTLLSGQNSTEITWTCDTGGNNATIEVTVTDADGCNCTGSVTVRVDPAPSLTNVIATPAAVCGVGNSTLSAEGNGTISWYFGSCVSTPLATGPSYVVTPSVTTTYYAQAIYGDTGCTSECVPVTVRVDPVPTLTNVIATPAAVCEGQDQNATLSGQTDGNTILWYIGSCGGQQIGSGLSIEVSPNGTTTYYAQAVNGTTGCTSECVEVTVTVSPKPTPGAYAEPQTVCLGETISVYGVPDGGTGNYTKHRWDVFKDPFGIGPPPLVIFADTQNATFSPSVAGEYELRYTVWDDLDCFGGVRITVYVNEPPIAAIDAQNGTTVCLGGSIPLGGSATNGTEPYSYEWAVTAGDVSGSVLPANAQNATFTAGVAGNYTVTLTVTDANNCTNATTIDLEVYDPPDPEILAEVQAVCPDGVNGTIPLAGIPIGEGYTYLWSVESGAGGGVDPADAPETTFTGPPGNYTVTLMVTDGNGCQNSTFILLEVYDPPVPNVSPDPAAVCAGKVLELLGNPSGGSGVYTLHEWTIIGQPEGGNGTLNTNSTEQNATFSATVVGEYLLSYKVTDSNGCMGAQNATVTVNPNPICIITAPETVEQDSEGNVASVDPATPDPVTYAWTLTVNGEDKTGALLEDGQNTPEITFKGPDQPWVEFFISVVITDGNNCTCGGDPGAEAPDGIVKIEVTPKPMQVPTVSQWGMIVFVLLLGGAAVTLLRRKRSEA